MLTAMSWVLVLTTRRWRLYARKLGFRTLFALLPGLVNFLGWHHDQYLR
jgi:hypothetical protein